MILSLVFCKVIECMMYEEEESEKRDRTQIDHLYFILSVVILTVVLMLACRKKVNTKVSGVLKTEKSKSLKGLFNSDDLSTNHISITDRTYSLTKNAFNEKKIIKINTSKEKVRNLTGTKINLNSKSSKDPFQNLDYLVDKFKEDILKFYIQGSKRINSKVYQIWCNAN